jgi:5-methylcytosine-specific restriction endonuclease McrA
MSRRSSNEHQSLHPTQVHRRDGEAALMALGYNIGAELAAGRGVDAPTGPLAERSQSTMFDSTPELKKCTKCHAEYPRSREYFYKNAQHKDGLGSNCKLCHNKITQQYHADNIEKANEQSRQYYRDNTAKEKARKRKYYLSNKAKVRAICRSWEERNPERSRAIHNAWKRNNPDKANLKTQKRKARLRSLPATLTATDWENIKASYNYSCAYCGKAWYEIDGVLHQDHVVPVKQGGGFVAENIVPACKVCNSKKGGRTPDQAGMPLLRK